ncbi:hypothetical protein FOA52_011615 [Chlamydomonas sp. UWO 241]|nr:hypothetical protein FOA52_011615 [Chlamydomonas sp. UWO 241]
MILGNPKDFKIWSRASSSLGASSDLTPKCSSAPSVAQSEQDEREITNDEQTAAFCNHGDCHVVVSRRGTKEDALHFDLSDLSDYASSYYPSNDPQLLLLQLHEELAVEHAEPACISGIEAAAALHLSYQSDIDSSSYSSDDEGTASSSDIEEETRLLLLLLQEVEEQAAERVQFVSKSAIETAASLHRLDIGSSSYSSDVEETATDAYHSSSSYSSNEEEQEQQQQQVEAPLDVSSLLTNTQSAHQLSSIFSPSVVLTFDACMGGQMPMCSAEEEQADEDVHSSQLKWDEWQARVAARTTTVEYEEEPAPVEERIVAASLALLCTE